MGAERNLREVLVFDGYGLEILSHAISDALLCSTISEVLRSLQRFLLVTRSQFGCGSPRSGLCALRGKSLALPTTTAPRFPNP